VEIFSLPGLFNLTKFKEMFASVCASLCLVYKIFAGGYYNKKHVEIFTLPGLFNLTGFQRNVWIYAWVTEDVYDT